MLMKQVCSGELYLINKIANAWKDMTRCSIINCFYKAGFKVDTLLSTDFQVDNSTDDTELTAMWEKIKKTENGYDFSYFEYVNIDKDLPAFETYTDQDIMNIVNDIDENDDEDFTEQTEVIDKKTMLEYISKMQVYLTNKIVQNT